MMSYIKESLPTMMELARDRSELSRIQLANMLADVFLRTDVSLSLRESEMVDELIDQLMLDRSPQVRDQLVQKFADVSRMPRRIANNLAKEDIEIARPILMASSTLTDNDLVTIVEEKGGDYALAVAQRLKISEAVADALVITGDVRVMREVAENLGAHLGSKALNVVADAARYSTQLREPLFRRPEMNVDIAMKLYWWVEQDLRRFALKRFGINSGQIDRALASTISTFLNSHTHEKANDDVMSQVADWMEEHQAVSVGALPQVLRMGHFRLFNMMLSRLTGLGLTLIDAIINEIGARGLAAICRSLDIDKPGFVSLFLLSRGGRPGEQIVHPRELSHALAAFDRMTPAIAKDLLNTWKSNPDCLLKHREEAAAEERATSAP